VIAVSGLQNNF